MSLGKGLKDFARANGLNMGKRNSCAQFAQYGIQKPEPISDFN